MRSRRLAIGGTFILVAAFLPGAFLATPAPPAVAAVAGLPAWQTDVKLPLDLDEPNAEVPTGVTFNDVEAVGPHDVWAVGTSGRFLRWWARPALWHWHDGRWHAAAMPRWLDGSKVGGWVNQIQAVGGSSPEDVWALGAFYLVTGTVTRAVHWDGHRWAKFAVPSAPSFGSLQINSVLSFGKHGAWAFGCYCDLNFSPGFATPYIARFANGSWRAVTPRSLTSGAIWTGSAQSPSNIWAAMSDPNTGASALLHWNGKTWRRLPVPDFGASSNREQFIISGGIVSTKNGGVWLTGFVAGTEIAAAVHEINGRWTITKLAVQGQLTALVSDGRGGLWSVLQPSPSGSDEIWHYVGGHWHHAADPAKIFGSYHITWMAHVPGSVTSLAIGNDEKHELLLHG